MCSLTDIRTVVWKELRETLRLSGDLRNGLGLLLLPLVLAVITACAGKEQWLHPVMVLIFALFFPAFCILAVVADSFAGERERKTLEALLSTRLSDDVILLGKLSSMVLWAWAIMLLFFAVGLVTVNLVSNEPGPLFYSFPALLAVCVIPPLAALAAASFGLHCSLRASSVRQAQMTLGYTVMGLFFIPGFALHLIPVSLRDSIVGFVTGLDPLALVLSTVLLLLAEALVALKAARVRFRRARLILD